MRRSAMLLFAMRRGAPFLRMSSTYDDAFAIRLTFAQRQLWERAAAKHRRKLTDWIRIVCDDQALRDCPPEDEAVPVKKPRPRKRKRPR